MGVVVRLLLLFLLGVLLLRAAWVFVQSVIEGATRRPTQVPRRGAKLVRDPVCGTYVVRERALTSGAGDEMAYFCSERCRNAYVRRA